MKRGKSEYAGNVSKQSFFLIVKTILIYQTHSSFQTVRKHFGKYIQNVGHFVLRVVLKDHCAQSVITGFGSYLNELK
jgi:hypothetical protein